MRMGNNNGYVQGSLNCNDIVPIGHIFLDSSPIQEFFSRMNSHDDISAIIFLNISMIQHPVSPEMRIFHSDGNDMSYCTWVNRCRQCYHTA